MNGLFPPSAPCPIGDRALSASRWGHRTLRGAIFSHCLRRGAHRAPAGLPPAAPILPGQARSPRGVCPPTQHTRGGSTNGGMGVVLHPRRIRAPCQRPASPVSGVRGGCGLGDLGEAVVTPDTLPRRRFACFAAGGKVGRPAGRNPSEAETVGWKEDPSSVTAYAVTPSPHWGEGFMLARRIFCRVHHDEKIKS